MDRNYGDVVNRALELEAADASTRVGGKQRYDDAVDVLAMSFVAEYHALPKASAAVTSEIEDIARLSEADMRPVLDKVRYDLIGRIEEELGPSRAQTAMRTRLLGLGAVAGIVLVLAGAVALRQYNAIPISAALDTRPGIEQRAAALAKVMRYDDWNPGSGGLRRLLGQFALWPFEPSEAEIQGARELAGAIANSAEQLRDAGQACKLPAFGAPVTDEQIAFLAKIVARLRDKTTTWGNPPAATVFNAIRTSYPC